MKKKLILAILILAFPTWNFTVDIFTETELRPIKVITKITGLHLLGKRRVWTFDKSEEIFNQKGQVIERLSFDGEVCDDKHIYTYNKFDSLEKVVWLTGKSLTPQKAEIWTFDSLNRKFQNLVYEISKVKRDTFMYEKTTWYYDELGRQQV